MLGDHVCFYLRIVSHKEKEMNDAHCIACETLMHVHWTSIDLLHVTRYQSQLFFFPVILSKYHPLQPVPLSNFHESRRILSIDHRAIDVSCFYRVSVSVDCDAKTFRPATRNMEKERLR